MSQRKTEHPLRTIVLEYDDAKPETDYEKKLISDYLLLHDKAVVLKQQGSKLLYEYKLMDEKVTEAQKVLEPIAATCKAFLEDMKEAAEKFKDKKKVDFVHDKLFHYNEDFIQTFHADVLTQVADECKVIDKDYDVYEDAYGLFWKELETNEMDSVELYNNHDKYALNISFFDEDQEAFRETVSNISIEEGRDKVIDRYDAFIDLVNKAYAEIKEIQRLAADFYDDKGLLDSSLSKSYAKGNADPKSRPHYLIDPADSSIETFRLNYGMLASSDKHTLTVSVPQEVVKQGDTFMLQELIMQLQHFPKMIEKWIFAIDVEIVKELDIAMTDDEWKGHAVPVKWFRKLNSVPCIIFFIHDHDARAYMLMGDLLVDGKLKPAHDGEAVLAEGEVLQTIQHRLYEICWFFLMYCHNTGFDPEVYIEALMSDFDAAFTYEELYKKYDQDIAQGVQLKAVPQKNGKSLVDPEEGEE